MASPCVLESTCEAFCRLRKELVHCVAAFDLPDEEEYEIIQNIRSLYDRDLETCKVNLDPANQLGSRAVTAQQTPAHQLVHAEGYLQQ